MSHFEIIAHYVLYTLILTVNEVCSCLFSWGHPGALMYFKMAPKVSWNHIWILLLQQFYEIFSKTYFISILDSHVILWNSKQISMRFHKEFDTIVQLFEFNPLSKCANKAVYQICLFWNWTEWEQCTNSKSPVEWYAIFYLNTCLTCFFWIEKRDINRNSYRMSIYFLF